MVSRFHHMSHPFTSRSAGCGHALRFLPKTDSTNRQARAWLEEGADDGSVVVADYQTAGRGRFDRVWSASRGQNLLLTLILRRPLPRPAWLPLLTGLAVAETVAALLPTADVRLKWPNDVRVGGRKLAGILVESPAESTFLVGIGLNVNESEFPDDLATPPTSLLLESGQRFDRNDVFQRLMDQMQHILVLSEEDGEEAYRGRLEGVGQIVSLQDGRTGRMTGLDRSGGLVLHTDSGPIVVHSGDVSLRPPGST